MAEMMDIPANIGNDNPQDPAILPPDIETADTDEKSDWQVEERIQKALLDHLSTELDVAKKNNEKVNENFKTVYNMIHSIRNRKPNEWESDISLPEFLSRLITKIGGFCTQYFASTDYVENDLESDDPKDIAEAKAAKKLLNILLKDPDAYYYHKIVRLITFVFSSGYGIIKGGYSQRVEQVISHMNQKSELAVDPDTGDYLADDGMPFRDPTVQRAKFNTIEEPVYKDQIMIDKPTFDVYPNQSVYMSPEYCYSLNDKEYVIFETEKKLSQLRGEASEMGYFNLDFLDDETPEGQRGEKTYNEEGKLKEQPQPPEKTFVEYERWGTYPARQEDDRYVPAIDAQGKFEEGAELVECVIHYIQDREKDTPRHIIGFRKSKHTRRPMVKFLCYVDMVDDNGIGDGEINRELQIAVDDNFNIGAYRTTMAAMPSFKGKKFSGVPEKVKTGPQHVTMLENMNDLEQWIIADNPQGTGYQHNLLCTRMDFAMATSPQTGGMPADRAETATVGAINNQRQNIRSGMVNMNLNFIGFNEFYRMLLTLCNDFMLPETLNDLLGKEVAMEYKPKRKDRFRPTSQALENDESKQFNIKTLQGLWGMTAPIQNPNTPKVLNMIWAGIVDLMGTQHAALKSVMFEDDPETVLLYQLATGSKGTGTPPAGPQAAPPMSNQQGTPQRQPEQQMRSAANG
uniref:Portal protein n=1 Tax=viral metagenome TaxID=1070528 RepID=A0A6M3KAX1_9ZZZZ